MLIGTGRIKSTSPMKKQVIEMAMARGSGFCFCRSSQLDRANKSKDTKINVLSCTVANAKTAIQIGMLGSIFLNEKELIVTQNV